MTDFAWSLLLVGLCVLFALVLRVLQWWLVRLDEHGRADPATAPARSR
ncbi:hypothetical protein [Amycolatopsis sp. PS_44_ISF1]|nr:hypothetical protein [Amycolatopsis sp. PS_44_ISF1]MDT8912844.1 hypothetical protein [Amycolatopsis sp. PS_44_ISF1]